MDKRGKIFGILHRPACGWVVAVITVCALLSLFGCSPIKAYPGPELPPEKVATFLASYSSSEIDLDGVYISNIDFISRGASLIPGNYPFTVRGTALGGIEDCDYYGKMDYSGYERCRDKASSDKQCNCYDYLEIRKKCYRQVRSFSCEGRLAAEAGRTATLTLHFDGEESLTSSIDAPSAVTEPSGSTNNCQCQLGSWRMKIEDSSEGYGQGTALYRGVYRCD